MHIIIKDELSLITLTVRKIKFNKYKHKKNKWITRGILKSIKFNRFHNILRQSIKEAKRNYFVRTFERFKYDIKQLGLPFMRHYIVKRRNPFQVYSLTMVKCYGIQLKSPTRLINISWILVHC